MPAEKKWLWLAFKDPVPGQVLSAGMANGVQKTSLHSMSLGNRALRGSCGRRLLFSVSRRPCHFPFSVPCLANLLLSCCPSSGWVPPQHYLWPHLASPYLTCSLQSAAQPCSISSSVPFQCGVLFYIFLYLCLCLFICVGVLASWLSASTEYVQGWNSDCQV